MAQQQASEAPQREVELRQTPFLADATPEVSRLDKMVSERAGAAARAANAALVQEQVATAQQIVEEDPMVVAVRNAYVAAGRQQNMPAAGALTHQVEQPQRVFDRFNRLVTEEAPKNAAVPVSVRGAAPLPTLGRTRQYVAQ
jgi:hypothetical protein